MLESDLAQVVTIEDQTFPDPWPEFSFRQCLSHGFCCRVLEQKGIIQAYAIMAIRADTGNILNLCVHPEHRQKNLGRTMLARLLQEARRAPTEAVFLEVRSSNQAALQLYRSMNFFQLGVRKDYYPTTQGREDALILAWKPKLK